MAAGPVPAEELFDPDFLRSLKTLRIVARRVPRDGRFAEQRSRDLGGGTEFRDFRAYAPGDDIRTVDWNIYRRLGRVFLRQFEELEDLPLHLMTDVSASMFLETPPRARAGLRCTLALAAIALNHHDTVAVYPFSDELEVLGRPQAGKGRVLTLARRLAELRPGGPTDLVASVRRLASMRLRRGLLAIVSDFFDPAGIDAVVEALRDVRHRLLFVQLVRAEDREPRLDGDVRLLDCETGAGEDVSVTAATLARYRDAYDRFDRTLTDFARRRGAGLLRLDAGEEVVPQLATLFESGSLAV